MDNVNWLSLLISSLIPIIIGMIWYSPFLFQKYRSASVALSDEKMKNSSKIISYCLALAMAFILSFFLLEFNNGTGQDTTGFDTFQHGAWHGVFVALIIVMPVLISNRFFDKKMWKGILINLGYWIISLALMGGILDAMNTWSCYSPCP